MPIELVKEGFREVQQTIYFDRENYLREQTSRPDVVREWIGQAEELLDDVGLEDRYFLLSVLGYCYRVLNEMDMSIAYFTQCFDLVRDRPTRQMITFIRLGEAYKYKHEHQKALTHFDMARGILSAHRIKGYEDFLCQHQAKCLIEMGEVKMAKKLLLQALQLRESKGDPALISSTKEVLHFLLHNHQ